MKLLAVLFLLISYSTFGISKYQSQFFGEDSLQSNISNIIVTDMDGNEVKLSSYSGKVLLIVNVASFCGYTKQYKGLEEIYRKYNSEGFEILAFPCNDFGSQEPGSNEEIVNFCESNYDITFKLFDKISVKGENKSVLYSVLTNNSVTGEGEIGWNFEKFLIDREGNIVKRYKSKVDPVSEEIRKDIESLLLKK